MNYGYDHFDYIDDESERKSSEVESVFANLVNKEVEKRTVSFFEEMEKLKKIDEKNTSRIIELVAEKNKLKQENEQSKLFETFKELFNKDKIELLFQSLNLQCIEINFDGMYSEKIPQWFKLIVKYYPDKGKVLTLLNLLGVEYPSWVKTFKLPFDYDEEELDLIFDKFYCMGMTNSEYFKFNMGFYYEHQSKYRGDLKNLLEKDYSNIPWNLFLQNKRLVEDKYFYRIIDRIINDGSYGNAGLFFRIQEYQTLTNEQILKMIKLIPDKVLYDSHKRFINANKNIIQLEPSFAERFKDEINDNQFSPFYYLNFPFETQRKYILRSMNGYKSKFEKVKSLNISKQEKLKLLQEIAEIELGEEDEEINDAEF